MQYTYFRTKDAENTMLLGETLAQTVSLGNIFPLYGTLGTGKTAFTKGYAKGFGISQPVTSPTFVLVHEYKRDDNNTLFHVDMYRLHDYTDLDAVAPERFLPCPDGVTIVEWAERLDPLLKEHTDNILPIYLYHSSETERLVALPAEKATEICDKCKQLKGLVSR